MEGTENLETRPVHVLRHRFELSQRLSQSVMEILQQGTNRFQVFGTKRVAVEAAAFYGSRFDRKITKLTDIFRNYGPISVGGQVSIREGEHARTYVALRPAEQQVLDQLVAGLDVFPDVNTKKIPQGHYVTFAVATNGLLRSADGREEAARQLREKLADLDQTKFHSIAPLAITGYDATMSLPPRSVQPGWQDAS